MVFLSKKVLPLLLVSQSQYFDTVFILARSTCVLIFQLNKMKLRPSVGCVCVYLRTHLHTHIHTDINLSARRDRYLYMILKPGRCAVLKVDLGIIYISPIMCSIGEM